MNFEILMGVPEMAAFWNDLVARKRSGQLSKDEKQLVKKLTKVLGFLRSNPRHNSLQSHEIKPLSRRYGQKVFESYLENNTPGAGRLFWAYGSKKNQITIIGLEPHPEDKKNGSYDRIDLSRFPK